MNRRKVTAWTDGACKGNPGYGGWAVHIEGEDYSGSEAIVTNNYMELFAVYMAIYYCPRDVHLTVVTDSKLVHGWLRLGWRIRQLHNLKVIQSIFRLLQEKNIALDVSVVKGHAQDDLNNHVDWLASEAASELKARMATFQAPPKLSNTAS